ncbi:MAG: PAS domain S-box protein [Planctomycetes bacterium]|nr:PAS domain S-box protein [Planctomycetota bacterium]
MARSRKSRVIDDVHRPRPKEEHLLPQEPADQGVEELAWLARIPQENPDPVLRVSAEHVLLYSNPAGEELCRRWGCRLGQKVPAAIQALISAALAEGAVVRQKVAVASHTYGLTVAPSVANGYVTIYARDITDCQRAQEALRQAEERFRTIFDTTSDGILLHDLETRKLTMGNKSCLQMLGYTEEEFLNLTVADLHPEEDLPFINAQIDTFLQGRTPIRRDIRFKRKDGSILFGDVSPDLVRLDGKPHVVVALKDITERKRMEEELRRHAEHLEELVAARTGELQESEARYRSLYHSIADGIFVVGVDGQIDDVNESACAQLGYTRAELIGMPLSAVSARPDFHLGKVFDRLRAAGSLSYETAHRRKDGTIVPVELSVTLLEYRGRQAVLGVARDIAERKRAEEALRESEAELAAAQRLAHIGSWQWNIATDTAHWSEETFRIFGLARGPLQQHRDDFISRIVPEDRQRVDQALSDAVSGTRGYDLDYRIRLPDGRERVIHARAQVLRNGDGQPITMHGTVQDITERRQAEETLRESEERFRTAFEEGAVAMALTALDSTLLKVNSAFCRMLGFDESELVGRSYTEITHPDDRDANLVGTQRLACGVIPSFHMEKRYIRKDGAVVWGDMHTASVRDAQGRPLYCVTHVQDITDRRQAEEALRRLNEQLELQVAQRTEELRRTVDRLQQLTLELSQAEDRERKRIADILHDDVQQTLAAAKFHLNLLSTEPRSAEESQEIVGQVKHMLKDAIEKSRRLSHELSPALYQVELLEILNWLARHMQEKHGLTVRVEAHGPVDSPSEPLKAFLYKVAQELLFNVVKHAGVREVRLRVRRMGPSLYLSVIDRGRGFDPQKLERAGGVGLLGIRERVQLLGGRMKIRSTPGAGSRFLIAVPYEPAPPTQNAVPSECQDISTSP